MHVFIYNMDRNNEPLVKSLDDFLVRKNPLLEFGSISADTIVKNNGYLVVDCDTKDQAIIWTAIRMISKGANVIYWVTDYSDKLKFVTLKRKTNQVKSTTPSTKSFKKSNHKSEPDTTTQVEVTPELLNDLQTSMSTISEPDKPMKKKLKVITLNDLDVTKTPYFDVKYNPNKPLSKGQLGSEAVLIKIPENSWLIIRTGKYKTNNEEIRSLLSTKGFLYDETLQDIE